MKCIAISVARSLNFWYPVFSGWLYGDQAYPRIDHVRREWGNAPNTQVQQDEIYIQFAASLDGSRTKRRMGPWESILSTYFAANKMYWI